MIQFKINGKKASVPSEWDDLKFGDYCEIIKINGDPLKLVSSFSGTDYETLKKATIVGLEEVLIALSFLKTTVQVPIRVDEIGGYKLPVNKTGGYNIQYESLAQFEDMRAIMLKTTSDPYEYTLSLAKYVAIYLQKIRDGEYDHIKAMEMVEEVNGMQATKVLALGSFFLLKLVNLLNGIVPSSRPINQSQKKSKRVTTSSRKPSGSTARSRKRR